MSFWAFIIIGIVILGIIAYANPQLVDDVKEKIKTIYISVTNQPPIKNETNSTKQINTPTLISKCTRSFNECKSITTRKYGISISLLEIERFNDKETAMEFYTTWKGILTFLDLSKEEFPLVLLALTVTHPEGKIPSVIVCNEEGELTQDSKEKLSCG